MFFLRCCFHLFLATSFLSFAISFPVSADENTVESLLSQMTVQEKIRQLHQTDTMEAGGVPRLGLPPLRMADGPHGVRAGFIDRERTPIVDIEIPQSTFEQYIPGKGWKFFPATYLFVVGESSRDLRLQQARKITAIPL